MSSIFSRTLAFLSVRWKKRKKREKAKLCYLSGADTASVSPRLRGGRQRIRGEDHVVVAKIDCDVEAQKEKCGAYDISGYPTLK
jgi:hypothetical protein